MAALTSLMTRFCAGEDSWLARCSPSDPSTSETRDGNGKPRRNKDRRWTKDKSPKSTAVNAGFKGSRQNQEKSPPQDNRDDPSNLIKSWTGYVRYTVLLGSLLTIPTETVGFSNNPADSMPNTRGSTHQAKTRTNPKSRAPGNKRTSHKK